MNILNQFYENEGMREAVKAFMIEQLKEMATDRVFKKQSVAGIHEGRVVVDKTFERLEELYGRINVNKPIDTR